MVGWTSKGFVRSVKSYTPLEKSVLMTDIESCLRSAKNGFTMVYVSVMLPNSFTVKCAYNFTNMDDLLCELMERSLTCSIAHVSTGLEDHIMFLILVETDGSTTNLDSDVVEEISKLRFMK